MFVVGAGATKTEIVTNANTAITLGSGLLPVYATPAMVALMEGAAVLAIAKDLNSGESSVGISISVEHLQATSLNKRVVATATLTAMDGRKLSFNVELHDDNGNLLGRGTHERMIIDVEKFMSKLK